MNLVLDKQTKLDVLNLFVDQCFALRFIRTVKDETGHIYNELKEGSSENSRQNIFKMLFINIKIVN